VRLVLGTTVLATVAGCGSAKKLDPYAASLAKGSEHVEIVAKVRGRELHGAGDFTNSPDRGRYTFTVAGKPAEQIFANDRLYVHVFGRWLSAKLTAKSPQTPAEMFRKHLPATFENGLVKSITVHDVGGTATYTFSKYGEHVSVTVPKVKGS
jgi:hypothetical protein